MRELCIEHRFPSLALQFVSAGQGIGREPTIVGIVAAKQNPPQFRHDLGPVPKFRFCGTPIAESHVGLVGVSRRSCSFRSSEEENCRFPV